MPTARREATRRDKTVLSCPVGRSELAIILTLLILALNPSSNRNTNPNAKLCPLTLALVTQRYPETITLNIGKCPRL